MAANFDLVCVCCVGREKEEKEKEKEKEKKERIKKEKERKKKIFSFQIFPTVPLHRYLLDLELDVELDTHHPSPAIRSPSLSPKDKELYFLAV